MIKLPSPETRHWNLADCPSLAEVLCIGDITTGGDRGAPVSGETTSGTKTRVIHFTNINDAPLLNLNLTFVCLTLPSTSSEAELVATP